MLAFLIAATLQVGAGSTAEFPVTFRQDDARWPVVVNATGVVTQDGDGLRVRLGSVQVADQRGRLGEPDGRVDRCGRRLSPRRRA